MRRPWEPSDNLNGFKNFHNFRVLVSSKIINSVSHSLVINSRRIQNKVSMRKRVGQVQCKRIGRLSARNIVVNFRQQQPNQTIQIGRMKRVRGRKIGNGGRKLCLLGILFKFANYKVSQTIYTYYIYFFSTFAISINKNTHICMNTIH